MKRKPLSKVAIPAVSPKKQLRNSRSQENKETRPSLTLQADLNKEQQSKDECSIGKGINSSPFYQVQIRIVCAPKIAFISVPINLNMCFGCSKVPSH